MKRALIIAALILSGCTTGCTNLASRETPAAYFKTQHVPLPRDYTVSSCRGYGCQFIDTVTLTRAQWQGITRPLKRAPKTAAQEREKLKTVIGLFETQIGAMTGAAQDRAGTYGTLGPYQQDCVDESTNTTAYLMMLQNHGLLRFHTVGRPDGRLPILGGSLSPHQTAILVEKESGAFFAIDSWFHDNGHPAEIAPLADWKTGWRP